MLDIGASSRLCHMNLIAALRRFGYKDGHKQRDRREGRPRIEHHVSGGARTAQFQRAGGLQERG
jgi:hypothetical protein